MEGALDMGHARALLALPVDAADRSWRARSPRKGCRCAKPSSRVAHALHERRAGAQAPRADRDMRGCEEELSESAGHDGGDQARRARDGGKLVDRYREPRSAGCSILQAAYAMNASAHADLRRVLTHPRGYV